MHAAEGAAAGEAGAPAADHTDPCPMMRTPGERFTCRVSIENVGLSVEAAPDVASWGTKLNWEELQVRCEYSGVVQKTRWMPLPLAFEQQKQAMQRAGAGSSGTAQSDEVSHGDADSSISLDDEPTYGAGVHAQTGTAAATPGPKPRVVKLDYSPFNNCSFGVEFTSGDEEASADVNAATRRVRSKRSHRMTLTVEAQNLKRLFSTTGGQAGDQKPTSASKEAINAAFQKGAAKLSAWARGAFAKKSTKKDLTPKEREQLEEQALAGESAQAQLNAENPYSEGVYKPVALPTIDFSEAFNSPSGRKRYHLLLKPEKSKLPHRGEGVPLLVAFTVVAHYYEPSTVALPSRNFHSFAFVMDQMTLNASEAAEVTVAPKRHGSSGVAEEPVRKVTGYGYAFTTNTAHSSDPVATSRVVSLDVTRQANGHYTRVIDFASQHRTLDERQLKAVDYEELPTTACIVSSDCLVANPERVGHRVLCVSRYKTSNEGLCKPSYKCQVTFTLIRQFDNGDVEHETSESPIDLSAMLNQELFTSRDREVRFSLGEILYMRFRRFCFDKPEFHVAPLLMPFDYDNTGVVIRGACGPVASWTRRKTANQQPPPPPQQQQHSPSADPENTGAVYGANEVGEGPFNTEDMNDTDSTTSAPSVDPNNPFYSNSRKTDGPASTHPAAAELANPFAAINTTDAPSAPDTVSFEFTGGHRDPEPEAPQATAASDDFFMDGWGTESAGPPTTTGAGATPATGVQLFSTGGDSQIFGHQGGEAAHTDEQANPNMFSTESRPAFVLEPMPGEENALDWTKWGQ